MTPAAYNFEIGFGLGKNLDPSYGSFTAFNFQSTITGNLDQNGNPIRNVSFNKIGLEKCGLNKFPAFNQTLITKRGISDYLCF